ncbi:hypothetical protein [Mucilaginibacter paludis]|uniref:SprT-like domain-containing protein n=1 Tax=Mucilaginibacter paludis DSM 18603 TaxID=714943 RepID=H1YHY2_9SPHI|nr:hypothetical protein [Mucilaginibacter paludis]EHQ25530.1 hypothetical protein Mucpa_1369 [Mucilaginibacter paludis DSM 18603]
MKNKFLSNLAPFKSRSLLLLVSLILICYSACKKDHDLPQLSSASIKDPFIASLAENLKTYDKSFIDSINQLGKIDWNNVIVRHTSSSEMPVNFILPIIKGDQPCNQVIEFGFSKDKKFVKAAIRKLETAVLSTSSSNKQMITEQERTEHILYHFSQRGVRVSNSIIEAEHQRAQLYTLNKKNVLKAPSVGKQNNNINNPAPISYCQTQLIFDFYISYQIEVNSSNSYDTYSKLPEGMEPATIQFELSKYFFEYLMSNYIPYLTDQSTWNTNALFIYNMDDTNGQLGYFIQDALQYAMQQVQQEYAPQMWSIGLSYFNYSTRSNCNGSTTADGGWVSLTDDDSTPPDDAALDTINHVKNPCLKKMVSEALKNNIQYELKKSMNGIFANSTKFNLSFIDTLLEPHTDGITTVTRTSTSAIDGGSRLRIDGIDITIALNSYTLPGASKEYISVTILHEALHAYFRTLGYTSFQHDVMVTSYIPWFVTALQGLYPNITEPDAKALAYGGLMDSVAFFSSEEQAMTSAYGIVNNNYKTAASGTPCNL